MKFALFNASGVPEAFFDDGVTKDIPKDAVRLSEDQWFEFISNHGRRRWSGTGIEVIDVELPVPGVPQSVTLSDWRVGLTLWGRIDDVTDRVEALIASSDPKEAMLGKVARERMAYANTVLRSQLMQLREVFGFSEAEVDESMWRAERVAQGDLSGSWPVTAQ